MALTSTITDPFNDNSLASIWDASTAADPTQVTEVNNQIQISHTANAQYNTLLTTSAYNITSSSFFVGVTNVGNQALASHEVIVAITVDSSNETWFTISGGNISAYKKVATVQVQVGSSISYSASNHRYLRFRESAGTIFWDTSDGITWTNRWSLADPFSITSIKPTLQSGCYANEASSSFGHFDNFNILPSSAPLPHVSAGGNGMSTNERAS